MKGLIWGLTFLGVMVLNLFLRSASGISLGGILILVISYFIGKSLCKAWDETGKNKEPVLEEGEAPQEEGLSESSEDVKEAATISLPSNFCSRCGNELIPESAFCSKCGEPVIKE